MDWFLYDNGLRHERINVFKWFLNLFKSRALVIQRNLDFLRTKVQTYNFNSKRGKDSD